ncbi:uncharacterized protein LOC114140639 isoform X2 [Xiphophorus couchianus]|uniref:uncharacterized protein LOC114140639 isoform X2 n=1 Tax=Xiphophorus couchianus TaxID=32473 RepID=UPI001016F46B|nr:uncharacterized protein LOC114140639 isoform X2 [Xiphophorus couchianus]
METSCWFLAASLLYLATGQQEVSISQQEVSVLQDVMLVCRGGVANISVLKWSRPDLIAGGYVYFYRNKRSFERYQHSLFHGRVMLRDAAMMGGDASLILRNASFLDAGTYECHLQGAGPGPEVRRSINLTVTDTLETPAAMMDGGARPAAADGDSGKETGRSNSLVAAAVAVVVAIVVVSLKVTLERKYLIPII